MPINTGQISSLLATGLRNVMFQAYNEQPPEYSRVLSVKTSKKNYEEDLEFVGLGTMPQKPEGVGVIYADPKQGEIVRLTPTSFGAGFRITREAKDDDLYNIVKPQRMAKELGKGARNVREVRSANVFNNAFTTTGGFPKAGTSQTLAAFAAIVGGGSTSHTLIGAGGGTFQNGALADLAQASLEAAIVNFMQLVDENSIPIVVVPKTLLVTPTDVMVARELLGSEYKPYTQNNEINPTRVDKLSLEVNHYLTDADSWFVLADKSDHTLQMIVRTDLEFEYGDDFDTGDTKVKAFQRFYTGWTDWRGVYCGQGA